VRQCSACNRKPCVCNDANGPKQPYEEPCDHDYDEDEDAAEFVCVLCGDREPMPLDRIMRQ
jgi:hypothetical protein